jgi:hypothetical protein
MYNIILSDLKFAKDIEDLYYRFKTWQRCYRLSINQCQHILIKIKDYRPDLTIF